MTMQQWSWTELYTPNLKMNPKDMVLILADPSGCGQHKPHTPAWLSWLLVSLGLCQQRGLGLWVLGFLSSLLHIYNTNSQSNLKRSFWPAGSQVAALERRVRVMAPDLSPQLSHRLNLQPQHTLPVTPVGSVTPHVLSLPICTSVVPSVNWPDFPTSFGHYEAEFHRMLCSPVMKGAI